MCHNFFFWLRYLPFLFFNTNRTVVCNLVLDGLTVTD